MELIGSIIVTAVAAGLAYILGLRQARVESRSARRLAWLEKAQAQLLAAAGDLNNARAADLAGIVDREREEYLDKALLALGELRHLELEAEAYLPNAAAEAVSEAVTDIISVSTAAGRLRAAAPGPDPDKLFEIVRKLIYHAASRIAGEIRQEMGLDELSREWRLYDAEIRRLRTDVQHFEESGAVLEPPAQQIGETDAG